MRLAPFVLALALTSGVAAQSNVRQGGAVRASETEQLGYRCEVNYGDRWTREGDHAVNVNVITFAPLFETVTAAVGSDPSTEDGKLVWSEVTLPDEDHPVRLSASGLRLPQADGVRYIQTFDATAPDGTDLLISGTGVRAFLRGLVVRDLTGFGCFVEEE